MITKPVNKNREKPSPPNTTKADVNEILVGYFIKPGTQQDPFRHFSNKQEVKRAYKDKSEQLTYDLWYMEMRRAEEMAKVFLEYAKRNKYGTTVKEIVWTARNGSLGEAVGYPVPQTGPGKNPSDIVVCFSNPTVRTNAKSKSKKSGSWLGLSAKSTAGSGDIGFANPGLGTISKSLFGDEKHLSSIIDQHTAKFKEKYKNLKNLNNTEMKNVLKSDPGLKDEASKYGLICLRDIRDAIVKQITEMKYEEWQAFMLDFVQAEFQGPHYIKITGHGTKEPFTASMEDPAENKKTRGIKGPNLLLEESGDTSINVYSYEDKPLFKIRMKWESSPLSSTIKLSGDPLR